MANETKEKFVAELTEDIKSSEHFLVTEYQGMSAEEFDQLRAALRNVGSKYKVVKNRLARIAFESIDCKDLNSYLKGPSAIAYHGNDGAAVAKVLFKFSEDHPNMKVKAGKLFGTIADAKMLKAMASLPSREVLLATLASRLNSPLVTLARTLQEPLRSLHAALSAAAKKKEAAA